MTWTAGSHKYFFTAASGILISIAIIGSIFLIPPTWQNKWDLTGFATRNASVTVNVSNASLIDCLTTLEAGWNLISIPCFPNQFPHSFQFENVSGLISVFAYDPSDAQDPWKSYNPSLSAVYEQDEITISRQDGYFVRVSSTQIYNYTSFYSSSNQISLSSGWNLVGYPRTTNLSMNATFVSIYGNYNVVKTLARTSQTYLIFYPDTSSSSNSSTVNETWIGYGYWINMSNSTTWDVPS